MSTAGDSKVHHPGAWIEDARYMDVVVPEDVRQVIIGRGGALYVWVSVHGRGCMCTALLEASTSPPPRLPLSFRRVRQDGFDLYVEADRRHWPGTLELALRGRGRKVRAFWNGQAWVG